MSFLPHEDDNAMTLQEALNLIDPSCDLNRNSSMFPPLEDLDELLESVMEYSPEDAKNHEGKTGPATKKKGTKEKKRVRSRICSSTVLQRRRKANLLSLREQVMELQNVLNEWLSGDAKSVPLKLNAKTYADLKTRGLMLSRWHQYAVEQYERRNKSQKQNRQLRKILTQQRNTSESMGRILRRQSLAQDMNYLKHESPARLHGSFAGNDTIAQLENAAENYQHSALQLELSLVPSLSSPMQTNYKEQRNDGVIEFITSTPMSCSMVDASNVMWSYHNQDPTPGSMPNVFRNMVSLTLQHLEDTLQFERLHYVRKHSEPEKIVFACSDILLLRSKGLKFCSKGSIAFMPLPADPLHSCVVHTVYQLYVDNEAGQKSGFAKDVALGALSKFIRLCWQAEQSRLVDEATRVSG